MHEVSVVIPTRNRTESLMQVLECLKKQLYPLKEIIIVDSSDVKMDQMELNQTFSSLNIRYIYSVHASVCIQRNVGIKMARAPYIFLCDDDITLPEDYVSILMEYIEKGNSGAVSGLILQKENENWEYQYPPLGLGKLFFAFVFQQSVWGSVNELNIKIWQRPVYTVLKKYYKIKSNALSSAGWPLITEFHSPVFRTAIYGLGASIAKKEWLINSPYDEVLDPHGIGDNYGVAMGFPEKKAIHVVFAVKAYHHQSTENRLESSTTYYRRLMALHYFLKKHQRFKWWNKVWFMWSLVGHLIVFRNKDEHRKATKKALFMVLEGDNPYWSAARRGERVVELKL